MEAIISNIDKNSWYYRHNSDISSALIALKDISKNIVIWGASQGGLKVLDIAKRYNLSIKYFVDIDSQKQGKKIEDIEIKSPNVLTKDEFVLIGSMYEKEIALSLKQKGIEFLGGLLSLYDFNISNLMTYIKELSKLYDLLYDQDSKNCLTSIVGYTIDGDASKLHISPYKQYFHPSVRPTETDIIVDGGAYDGDTIKDFSNNLKKITKIYAFEPDKTNFLKLKEFSKTYNNIIPINLALWKETKNLKFNGNGLTTSSIINNDNTNSDSYTISATSIDKFFIENQIEPPTLIKMDIEGAELDAILGAKNIITTYKPKLQICLYHKAEHVYTIPILLKDWVPEYKMFLGHHSQNWQETILYCCV